MDRYTDEKTGAQVRILTSGPQDDALIYQTHPMWTPGMAHLVFNSTRTGDASRPHAVDMITGEVRCLAPDKAHDWVLARKTDTLYRRQGDDVEAVSVEAAFKPEALKPTASWHFDQLSALKPHSLTVDADERTLYAGLVIRKDECWGIAAIDLATGDWRIAVEVNFRVGHVQANPFETGIVMFCHETGGDAPQRTWVVRTDGTGLRPFYPETYDEWVTHEVWWGKDRAIFTIWPYDDEHKRLPHGIVSADMETGTPTVHSQYPAWHTHGSPDGAWAVGDDFDRNLWLVCVETGERRLLTQGHLGEGCKTHPHPSFTPDGKGVAFNSSRKGTEDIMLVTIPEWESLPRA
ncbi:MAG: hypothetical protein GY851_35260 [bacterium]|nr:hypothetical protein [bacterium]